MATYQEGIGVLRLQQLYHPAVAGLFLTMLVRTASAALVHTADKAEDGNIAGVERAHYLALLLQGLRIAVQQPFFLLSSSICSTCP